MARPRYGYSQIMSLFHRSENAAQQAGDHAENAARDTGGRTENAARQVEDQAEERTGNQTGNQAENQADEGAAGATAVRGASSYRGRVTELGLDRNAVLQRERERYGGVKVGSAFFGWLTATGVGVLLTALLTGAGAA